MKKIELGRITITEGEEYPLYCDLYVLEEIQERMSVSQFERDILGAAIVRDAAGNPELDENNRIKLRFDKYNIETILWGLTLMINEGLEIQAEQDGTEQETVTEKDIARICTMPLENLATAIHDAFNRCFALKKKSVTKETSRKRKTSK